MSHDPPTRSWNRLSLEGVSTYSLKGRHSKVNRQDFGQPWQQGGSLKDFLDRLPNILAAADLKAGRRQPGWPPGGSSIWSFWALGPTP